MAAPNAPNSNKFDVSAFILGGLVLVSMAFVAWEVLVLEGLVVTTPDSVFASSLRAFGGQSGGQPIVSNEAEEARLRSERVNRKNRPAMVAAIFDESDWDNRKKMYAEIRNVKQNECGYANGIHGLTEEELHPKVGDRHMVTPPEGGKLSMVCCNTTKGHLTIVAHHKWAPIGAAHFIDMVKGGYFDSGVPMMRCMKGFLCQFGLNNDPAVTRKNDENLKDDPNWLPEGPKYRENDNGVKRFARGYLAYAGAGSDTRGNQFIVSLKDNGPLAGGSPWEVPWGELVGEESFDTLATIYTGYDENGPSQGLLRKRGMDKEMREEFPKLDYIDSCKVIDEQTPGVNKGYRIKD
jgi:cyclophilin family peptidyl-prolyl cis-trans isomerase